MSDTPGARSPAGTDGPETERPLRILIGADTFAPDVNGAARFGNHKLRIAGRYRGGELQARGVGAGVIAPTLALTGAPLRP